jgi:hypothetical protein
MNWKLGSRSRTVGPVPRFLVFVMLFLAAANACIRGQTIVPKEPLEFDYCGNLVPATLPHMYRVEWRFLNQLGSERDPGKSLTYGYRDFIRLSEADFAIFLDSAARYGAREDARNKQFAAIREADRAHHPDLRGALSESAREAHRALIRDMDKALAEELDNLHARLGPNVAKALDERIVYWYRVGYRVPNSAPRASAPCAMPNP